MPIVGIDLGTTNSLIGVIEKGRPRLFVDENGSNLIPSIVAFPEQGEPVVGDAAKHSRTTLAERTIYSAKRFIGRGKQDVEQWMRVLPFDFSESSAQMVRFKVGERSYTPLEISSAVLKHLKNIAERSLGESVSEAVVTVPAYFNDAQRQATKLAGELAGMKIVRMVNEPTAACLAYGLHQKAKGNIAVFDLGGGTFDISILRVTDGIFEVLATHGDTALGGDDFDLEIVNRLAPEIQSQWKVDPMADAQLRSQLIDTAERLKRAFTEHQTAIFEMNWNGKHFRREVKRAEADGWFSPILKRAAEPCYQCLSDARISREEITDVILVGGSTRMPLVQSFVKELFGRAPISTLNPDEVVAMGAAIQANILAGQTTGMLLLDVIPLSLGIETMGGVVSKIIHRNSTIPISASQTFTTYVDGQVTVDLHVCQGERELVADNRSLARFQLRDLPPLPAGVPKIEVEFIVDANGILSVRSHELRTGKSASIAVNPSFGLSDSEVEKMLSDAYDNAEQDFESRFLAEARVEAEGLIRSTKKALTRGRELLAAGEEKTILSSIAELERAISHGDRKQLREKIDALNHCTHPLAEKVLNQAVSDALRDKEIT